MRCAVAVALVALVAGPARAEVWKAGRGSLAHGRAADSYVLSSDGAPGRYSEGSMIVREPVAVPYVLSARWRRLGPEAGRSLHVHVAGGVVLIKSGAIALWAYDDVAVPDSDWRPLPGYREHDEHAIRVAQDARGIDVAIDGTVVAHYALATTRARAPIGFGMKAAPGARTAIYLRDVAIASQ